MYASDMPSYEHVTCMLPTTCMYMYVCTHVHQYMYTCTCIYGIFTQYICTHACTSEFVITFEAWAKLAQKWLVCVPLRIHLEPIN